MESGNSQRAKSMSSVIALRRETMDGRSTRPDYHNFGLIVQVQLSEENDSMSSKWHGVASRSLITESI